MAIVAVVDIWNPVESGLDPGPDLMLADQVLASGCRPRGVSKTQSSVKKVNSRDVV
jgi:hypothetical protein